MDNIRVLLADDHAVVREGLKALISAEPGMELVGEASDGRAAVTLTTELDPDVVVVDVSMPELNGAEVTAHLKAERSDRKVLALTVHEDRGYMRRLLEAGAAGYVLKRAAPSELVQAIRAVAGGGTYLDPALATGEPGEFSDPAREAGGTGAELSERETEVVRLIALGYSNKEIAGRLKLSVKTVETYKTRSMEKLGVRTRVDIVQYAARRGWLAT
ncbi:response regulator transcription factor [Gemmata sp. JC717]|uniref:Response regulator transcription factor n=1 Tax=Gemmata algarum TaxID=2975278 RepID=A0ABU5F023_9BACT|nr:response regulator transcription factor [Gemmata algarum]MDY3556407.1 response regulator transcription factor [Gemmata algarum]MDY3560905.1 response regulator transcription factor [Gemmata algarum]